MLPYSVRSSCRRTSMNANPPPPSPVAALRLSSSAAASLLMYRTSACGLRQSACVSYWNSMLHNQVSWITVHCLQEWPRGRADASHMAVLL